MTVVARAFRGIHAAFVSAALLGCGGDADGDSARVQSCARTGCGGDVLGVWSLASSCLDPVVGSFPTCPGSSIWVTTITRTATYDFQTSGQMTLTFSHVADQAARIPDSCRNTTCEVTEEFFRGDLADIDAPIAGRGVSSSTELACQPLDAACHCSFTQSRSGTYTAPYSIDETTLTLDDPMFSMPLPYEFCVNGNELSLYSEVLGSASVLVRQ